MSAWARITPCFALTNGRVEFNTKTKGRTFVSVLPMTEAAARVNGESQIEVRRFQVKPGGPIAGLEFEGETGEPAPPQKFQNKEPV